MSRRRDLLIVLGAACLVPKTVFAQSKQTPVLVGWLGSGSRKSQGDALSGFKEGMAALGWKDGVNVVLEERWADGQYERLEALAEEMAAKKPAVIVATNSPAIAAAARAASTTPVVVAGGDPLGTGRVTSLAHPGGMITGVSNSATQVAEKFCELLLDAVPGLRRIGALHVTAEPFATTLDTWRRAMARRSVELTAAQVLGPEAVGPAMARLANAGAQALVVYPSPLLGAERQRIVELAMARRWPVIGSTGYADTSALLSYGANNVALGRRAAYYVDRILKGAKPGDLPIEQPTRFDLVINMKTAKALGITIPPSILVRADRVIE